MTFFRACMARIFLIAVVYLNSIPEQGLLDVNRILLLIHQVVEALRDGWVVERKQAADDLVFPYLFPNRTADTTELLVITLFVLKIVLNLPLIIATKPLESLKG